MIDNLDLAGDYMDINDYSGEDETYSVLFDGLITETEKAWLLDIDGQEMWFPKSICKFDNNYIIMPYWFAEQKELI